MAGISSKTVELGVLAKIIALAFSGERGTSLFFVISYLVDSNALCNSTNPALNFFLCAYFSLLILTKNIEIFINYLKPLYIVVVLPCLCFQYNTLSEIFLEFLLCFDCDDVNCQHSLQL